MPLAYFHAEDAALGAPVSNNVDLYRVRLFFALPFPQRHCEAQSRFDCGDFQSSRLVKYRHELPNEA
jgi:hypothetical protein